MPAGADVAWKLSVNPPGFKSLFNMVFTLVAARSPSLFGNGHSHWYNFTYSESLASFTAVT